MAVTRIENDWRRPGCDARCTVKYVFLPGLSGREPLEIHDPDAHAAYGQMLAEVAGYARRGWIVETGTLRVDLARLLVWADGAEVQLTPIETKILLYLAQHVDVICPYSEVAAAVWPPDWLADAAARHTLRVHLSRCRAKLGSAGRLIETRTVFGLRLRAEAAT